MTQTTNFNYNNRIVKHFWDANYIKQKHYHNFNHYGNIFVEWLFKILLVHAIDNKDANHHYLHICFF